jgi:hypothetical protein
MPYIVIVLVVALLVFLALLLSAGLGAAALYHALYWAKFGGGAAPPLPAPPPARTPYDYWDVRYSQGVPATLLADTDGSYFTPLPNAPGSLHYVTTTPPAVALGQTIRLVFALEGEGVVVPTAASGDGPPRLRLYLEQRNATTYMPQPNPTAIVAHELERWWSSVNVILAAIPEQYVCMCRLDPALWSSVYGRFGDNPLCGDGFASCLNDLGAFGFTFGATFAGHGVYLQGGPATFRLVSYGLVA